MDIEQIFAVDEFRRFNDRDTTRVPENKRAQSAELQQHTEVFLKSGGKVQEIVDKVEMDALPATDYGLPQSGKPGIHWSTTHNKWAVRTPCSQKRLGYAETVKQGVQMQVNYANRHKRKKDDE